MGALDISHGGLGGDERYGRQDPADFIEERKTLMGRDFSKEASVAALPLNVQRMHGHMAWLTNIRVPTSRSCSVTRCRRADLASYHTLWFARQNGGPAAEALLPLDPLRGWMDRVAAFGHGTREEMSETAALDLARQSEPSAVHVASEADPTGLRPGQAVSIRMDDMHDVPVQGTLVASDAEEIVIRHDAPEVGTVHLHVPRVGYEVEPVR